MEMFSFCHRCGQPYAQLSWPRVCTSCNHTHYRGSQTVAVALIPIKQEDGETLLMGVQRGIAPQIGEWALPGGYVDWAETLEEAAAREVREETHLDLEPGLFRIYNSVTTPDGKVLVFCVGPVITQEFFQEACFGKELDRETMAVGVVRPGQTLAFPLHTDAMNDFFEHLSGFRPQVVSTEDNEVQLRLKM